MNRFRTWLTGLLVAAVAGAACVGCMRNDADATSGAKKSADRKAATTKKQDRKAEPVEERQPQTVIVEPVKTSGDGLLTTGPMDSDPAEMPVVVLSEQHAATCLVNVGDTIPDVRLPDIDGKDQDLSKLLGDPLTVLVFWTASDPHSLVELADLAVDVASPLAARGVKVVGVCERDSAETAKAACQKQGVSFPVLVDGDGKFYNQLATAKLPRTYLLDSSGKVLWLDIEYARSTRHDLREALRSLLAQ